MCLEISSLKKSTSVLRKTLERSQTSWPRCRASGPGKSTGIKNQWSQRVIRNLKKQNIPTADEGRPRNLLTFGGCGSHGEGPGHLKHAGEALR